MQKKKNKLVCFPSLYSLSLYLSLYHFENPNEQTKKTTIEYSSTNTINKNHQTKTNSRTTSQQFETKKKN